MKYSSVPPVAPKRRQIKTHSSKNAKRRKPTQAAVFRHHRPKADILDGMDGVWSLHLEAWRMSFATLFQPVLASSRSFPVLGLTR